MHTSTTLHSEAAFQTNSMKIPGGRNTRIFLSWRSSGLRNFCGLTDLDQFHSLKGTPSSSRSDPSNFAPSTLDSPTVRVDSSAPIRPLTCQSRESQELDGKKGQRGWLQKAKGRFKLQILLPNDTRAFTPCGLTLDVGGLSGKFQPWNVKTRHGRLGVLPDGPHKASKD